MKRHATIAAAVLLAGCTVGPNFTKPAVDAPPAYAPTAGDVASHTIAGAVDTQWWDAFTTPNSARWWGVWQSRISTCNRPPSVSGRRAPNGRSRRRRGLPHLGGNATALRQRVSEKGVASLEQPAPGAPLEFDVFRPMVSASWELDLFGRVRRAIEAASADTDAAVEARHGLALSAIADLAQTYVQLRLSQTQQVVLERNIAIADRRRALVRDRFANGVATTQEVAQATRRGW